MRLGREPFAVDRATVGATLGADHGRPSTHQLTMVNRLLARMGPKIGSQLVIRHPDGSPAPYYHGCCVSDDLTC